jgi:hypothetical protein
MILILANPPKNFGGRDSMDDLGRTACAREAQTCCEIAGLVDRTRQRDEQERREGTLRSLTVPLLALKSIVSIPAALRFSRIRDETSAY